MLNHTNTLSDYISRITNLIDRFKVIMDDDKNLFITLDLKKAYLETIENSFEQLKFHVASFGVQDFKEVSHA